LTVSSEAEDAPDSQYVVSENPESKDEDEYEYEYDFRNDCEEGALSDRTEISLGPNLSTSRRLAIVLVLVLDFFSGVVLRSRTHGANRSLCQKQMSRVFLAALRVGNA
jgi:hypothetical protein